MVHTWPGFGALHSAPGIGGNFPTIPARQATENSGSTGGKALRSMRSGSASTLRMQKNPLPWPGPLVRHTLERPRHPQRPIGVHADTAEGAPHAGGAALLERFTRRLVRAVQDALRHMRKRARLAPAGLVVMDEDAFVVVHVAVIGRQFLGVQIG